MADLKLAEKLKILDDFSSGFNNQKKKVLVGRLSKNDELREKFTIKFIKTPSKNVDAAMGGGFPRKKITIVTGKPDSGKTFMLLETIAENMRKNPNFVAGWLESESSLSVKDIMMLGIDLDRFYAMEADPDGAEESLNAVQSMLASGMIDMFVVNSLKCLIPNEELVKGMESTQVALQARMNSKFMRKILPSVTASEAALVMVQHLTTKIGGYAPPGGEALEIGGGLAIRYGACTIIDMRKQSIQPNDPIGKEEGVKIAVTVKKNHATTGRYPYVKTGYYALYGQGTEKYLELLDLAVEKGILVKAGSYIRVPDANGEPVIVDGIKMQWQGSAKFRDYCINNPDFFKEISDKTEGTFEILSDEEVNKLKLVEEEEEKIAKEMGLEELKVKPKRGKKKS